MARWLSRYGLQATRTQNGQTRAPRSLPHMPERAALAPVFSAPLGGPWRGSADTHHSVLAFAMGFTAPGFEVATLKGMSILG